MFWGFVPNLLVEREDARNKFRGKNPSSSQGSKFARDAPQRDSKNKRTARLGREVCCGPVVHAGQ